MVVETWSEQVVCSQGNILFLVGTDLLPIGLCWCAVGPSSLSLMGASMANLERITRAGMLSS
jgi:hypothetical protein